MKIVVAGGTGFMGRHIVAALEDAGHEVAVISRRSGGRVPGSSSARIISADATDPSSLKGKLEGSDGLVNCVQFPNHPVEVPRKGLTYDRYDRGGTQNLLAEAQAAGVRRFVYISGAGADPSSDKTWYRAKGHAEAAVARSGLEWAILRPSWAYGPGDRALNRLAAIARYSPVVPQLGMRTQRVQPVYVEDVALAVRRTFEREAWRQTFEIGGPLMTMNAILRTLLEVIGKRRLIVPVPAPLAKLTTAPLKLLPNPPMTPQGIEFAIQDGIVDTTALEEVLGVHPVPLREGLSRYLTSTRSWS